MQRILAVLIALAALAGCAGLDIRPLTPEQAAAAHAGGGQQGYIVYAPMTVIELGDKDGCRVGAPFQLPDYSRPYLVRSRAGLGRSGVDVSISNGWMLGGIKDTSDNGVLLDAAASVLRARSAGGGEGAPACRAPGLYRLVRDAEGRMQFEPLRLY